MKTIKNNVMMVMLFLSLPVFSDEFYVVYQWRDSNSGDLMLSWNTGAIDQDIETEEGILSLIRFIEKKRGISGGITITYLKKLKNEKNKKDKERLSTTNGIAL